MTDGNSTTPVDSGKTLECSLPWRWRSLRRRLNNGREVALLVRRLDLRTFGKGMAEPKRPGRLALRYRARDLGEMSN
jgi:hypothetical protein